MSVLQNDPDIREALFGPEEQLSIQQGRFVSVRLRDLLVRYEQASRNERLQPIEWAKWSAFIAAAYFCGFVCHDGGEATVDPEKTLMPAFIRRLERYLGRRRCGYDWWSRLVAHHVGPERCVCV